MDPAQSSLAEIMAAASTQLQVQLSQAVSENLSGTPCDNWKLFPLALYF